MPKQRDRDIPTAPSHKVGARHELAPLEEERKRAPTIERAGFVAGLLDELDHAHTYYIQLVKQMSELQGRMDVAERTLCHTRDYLETLLGQTEEDVPRDWQKKIARVRFVGARLGDACLEILREHRELTMQALLDKLNEGQFRFRTGSPLREIHAALLRQPRVKREGERFIYTSRKKRVGET